ncbi:response regulator transcription factor [Nonomuraea sp. NPDC003707]
MTEISKSARAFSWQSADHLKLSDFRRLCDVLDEVLEVDDMVQFEERLERALARHFGWRGVAVVRKPCEHLHMIVFDPEAEARHRQMAILERLRRYLVPFVRHSILAGVEPDANQALTLTPREREVVELVANGLTNHQIAERLFISLGTVKKHLSQALDKNGCTSRTQLATLWRRSGVPG